MLPPHSSAVDSSRAAAPKPERSVSGQLLPLYPLQRRNALFPLRALLSSGHVDS
jgi:hypothetical protein